MYDWLIQSQVLSHDVPTSLDQVENALRFAGHFSLSDVKEFMEFIVNNDTTLIEWHMPYQDMRSDNLYLAPRSAAVVVGSFSRYPRSTNKDD